MYFFFASHKPAMAPTFNEGGITTVTTTMKCPSSTSISNYIIGGSDKTSSDDDNDNDDEVFTVTTKVTSSKATSRRSNSNSSRHKTKYNIPTISSSNCNSTANSIKKKLPFSLSASAVLATSNSTVAPASSTGTTLIQLNDQLVPREFLLSALTTASSAPATHHAASSTVGAMTRPVASVETFIF